MLAIEPFRMIEPLSSKVFKVRLGHFVAFGELPILALAKGMSMLPFSRLTVSYRRGSAIVCPYVVPRAEGPESSREYPQPRHNRQVSSRSVGTPSKRRFEMRRLGCGLKAPVLMYGSFGTHFAHLSRTRNQKTGAPPARRQSVDGSVQ